MVRRVWTRKKATIELSDWLIARDSSLKDEGFLSVRQRLRQQAGTETIGAAGLEQLVTEKSFEGAGVSSSFLQFDNRKMPTTSKESDNARQAHSGLSLHVCPRRSAR